MAKRTKQEKIEFLQQEIINLEEWIEDGDAKYMDFDRLDDLKADLQEAIKQ